MALCVNATSRKTAEMIFFAEDICLRGHKYLWHKFLQILATNRHRVKLRGWVPGTTSHLSALQRGGQRECRILTVVRQVLNLDNVK